MVVGELLDHIVEYRNKSAHGAFAAKPESFFARSPMHLLAAAAELFPRLDVLAGRQLIAVTEIRAVGGNWLVERSELRGVAPWRIASLELPRKEGAAPALVEGLYLVDPARPDDASAFLALRPLLDFDAEHETVRFLNGRRGKNVEMLCYVTGDRVHVAPGESPGVIVPESNDDPVEPGASATGVHRMIGDYELVSELGRGAMGVVYRAKQVALGREVALKVQPRPNDPKADARFRREVRALARVDHPNLVKVFTSGVEGEQFYYTMELLDGAPLTAISDALTRGDSSTAIDMPAWQSALSAACEDVKHGEKPLSSDFSSRERERPESDTKTPVAHAPGSKRNLVSRDTIRQIVTLMRQTADAAHALHEAGVLHRDIKPGNIQVTPDGSQAVLMDLGLAQLADDVEGRLTRTTQFVGTRRYASPEQQIDAQLDRPPGRCLQPRRDAVGTARPAAALRCHRRNAAAGTDRAACSATNRHACVDLPRGRPRPRSGRAQVPGETAGASLRHGRRLGGRFGAGARRRAGDGTGGGDDGSDVEVGETEADGGGVVGSGRSIGCTWRRLRDQPSAPANRSRRGRTPGACGRESGCRRHSRNHKLAVLNP